MDNITIEDCIRYNATLGMTLEINDGHIKRVRFEEE